jgi:peptidylprolyl isomerase
MRSFFVLLLLGVCLATVAIVVRSGMIARKNPGRPINTAMREAMDAEHLQYTTDDALLIARTYGNAHKLADGLQWVERAPGTGSDTPQIGNEIICQYDGRLLDGTRFDSSYSSGAPFKFRVGTGAVIKGWDEAFLTMHRGEKRTLILPYWLGYGDRGSPPKIPGRATLIFEVELLDWH